MSWEDRLENTVFEITTGDGKKYKPLWISGEKSVEYNYGKFDFINVEGSLIDRKKPKSCKYPLTFLFQGKNNIDESEEFERSAKDSRYWVVVHPFYGVIYGQPLSISRSDVHFNTTKVSVDFWETIIEDYPASIVSLKDRVFSEALSLNALGVAHFVSSIKPSSSDIPLIKENIATSSRAFSVLHSGDEIIKYKNKTIKALHAADNLVLNSEGLIKAVQLIVDVSKGSVSIQKRVQVLESVYYSLKSILRKNQNSKYYFEAQGATILCAIFETAVTPTQGDYATRDQVQTCSNRLLKIYNDYVKTIDDNQVFQYDIENKWNPSADLQTALHSIVINTVSGLSGLAFGAKQERIVEVEKNTNIFLLTHTYMGLDSNDKNLELFRKINCLGGSELFLIRKGRKIKYFV